MFITAVPITKLFAWGETKVDSGGHVLESEKDEESRTGVFYLALELKTHRGVDMCRQRLLFFLLRVVKITHVNMQKKILLSPTSSKSFFRVYPPSPKISKICTKPISLIPTDANGKIGNTEPG